jgi:hypothetical protein
MARRYDSKTALGSDVMAAISVHDLDQAMIRGSCPLCAVLREFQNAIIEHIDPASSGPLCNFHCWAVANSAPAMVALSVYANMIGQTERQTAKCVICSEIQDEESKRVSEFIADFGKVRFAEWMNKFGTLCLSHAHRLEESAPERLLEDLRRIVERNTTEIQEHLREYAELLKSGDHSGGGVLGKAAAFLVGFRGFSS